MTTDAYNAAFIQAAAELREAVRQRDYWNLEVARLQQLLQGLGASIEKSKPKMIPLSSLLGNIDPGITEVVQSIIRSSSDPMSAVDVRDAIKSKGYDISGYANELAMIHQTLKRLAKDKRIEDVGNGRFKRARLLWEIEALAGISRGTSGKLTPPPLMGKIELPRPPHADTEKKKK